MIMPSINVNRRHLEEARRRQALRQRAEGLESKRGQFDDFMKRQGVSAEERERELRKLDELAERLHEQAEYEAVDGL
jgi:hypothetical protein